MDSAEEIKSIPYSQIFDSIEIISLSSENEIIGRIDKLSVFDGKIFVLDKHMGKKLLAFDMNGNLLHKFGNIGRGDSEYADICDFTIDANNHVVYILDHIMRSISAYSIHTGEFINKISINRDKKFRSYNIQYSNGYIYADLYYDTDSPNNHLLQKIDPESGTTIETYLRVKDFCRSYYSEILIDDNIFFCDNNTALFSKPFMDVFISLEGKEPFPYLYIHSKDIISQREVRKMPREESPEKYQYLYDLNKINDMCDLFVHDGLIHVCYQQGAYYKHLFYNIETSTTTSVSSFSDDILFKDQQASRWLPVFGCSTGDGIFQYLNTDILPLVYEDTGNGISALNEGYLNSFKTISLESNPIILFYRYHE